MIYRIHRCYHGKEDLCRADVARRFVAADVLLPCLQCKSIRRAIFSVVRHTDQSAGHVALVIVARGEVSRVWSAESQRYSKTLCIPNCNISAEVARRFDQREGKDSEQDGTDLDLVLLADAEQTPKPRAREQKRCERRDEPGGNRVGVALRAGPAGEDDRQHREDAGREDGDHARRECDRDEDEHFL